MPFSLEQFDVRTPDGRNAVLLSPAAYVAQSGERIEIPAGIATDGASTPCILWRIFPPFGRYWRACVLHDYLYRSTDRPKEECDLLLLEAMESCGVGKIDRTTIYEGVKCGGWKSFEDDRKRAKS